MNNPSVESISSTHGRSILSQYLQTWPCIMQVKKNEYDGAACEDDVVDSGSMFGRQFSEVNAFGLSSGSVDYTSIGARDTRMSRVSALLLEVISIDLAPLSADRSAISSIPLAAVSMSSRGPFSVI